MAMRIFDTWSKYGPLGRPDWANGYDNPDEDYSEIDAQMNEMYDSYILKALRNLSTNLLWMEDISEVWYDGDQEPNGIFSDGDYDASDFRDWWEETTQNAYDYVLENFG